MTGKLSSNPNQGPLRSDAVLAVTIDAAMSENTIGHTLDRRRSSLVRFSLATAVALSSTLAAGGLSASTVRWTGTGGNDLWANFSNWQGGQIPVNGDNVIFAANPAAQARLDYSLILGSFTFANDATRTEIQVGAGTASALTFSGAGIVNNSPVIYDGGTLAQNFYADAAAGPVGGTILFTNTATIAGSLPVSLTARAATVLGGGGGSLVFQDRASTGVVVSSLSTVLYAEGAAGAGAGAGQIILRGDALGHISTAVYLQPGGLTGAAGGQLTVRDRARFEGAINNSGAALGGQGGRVDFYNNSAAALSTMLLNYGASAAVPGAEAVMRFHDNTTLNASVSNLEARAAGGTGGRLELLDRAVLGTVGGAAVAVYNAGSFQSGAAGGNTVFYGDARIAGAAVTILNVVEANIGAGVSAAGGTTVFRDRSRAGQATIDNHAAVSSAAGTLAGQTFFRDNASAEQATVLSLGSFTAGALGGSTRFFDTASAGSATLRSGGGGAGGAGGITEFRNSSTAANATLLADSGGTIGGQIYFADNASGATARVVVNAGALADISGLSGPGTTLRAIEGSGTVFLGSKTLTVGGTGLGTTFAGTLADGGSAGGSAGSFAKTGAGVLTLSGASTYTGSTAVNAGALVVNGSIRGSAVTVASSARLAGAGTVSAPVLVQAGGTLAPGRELSPGTLNIDGSLTLAAGSSLNLRLGAAGVVGGPGNDWLRVSGNVSLAGTLNVADSGSFSTGVYRLVDYGGSLGGAGLALGAFPAGFSASDFTVQVAVPNQVNLVVSGANVLFWDGAQTVANNTVNGGPGNWTTVSTNWTNASGSANTPWASRFAVFTAGAGTVTVADAVVSTGMQFVTTGYVVDARPGGSIALLGNAVLRVDPLAAASISAPLVGSGTLVKSDTGTLTLSGSNSYTGGTLVQDGRLVVTAAGGFGLASGAVTVAATATSELSFEGGASAGGVAITNLGSGSATAQSATTFRDTATADTASILNSSGAAGGGFTRFLGGASAGSASIVNAASALARGGVTSFEGVSSAAQARITNEGASNPSIFAPGLTQFIGNASAGQSTIFNAGAVFGGATGGSTLFTTNASAGTARITNAGGALNGAMGGYSSFDQLSNADNASIVNASAAVAGAAGGVTLFFATARAGQAAVQSLGATTAGAAGGKTQFSGSADAFNATLSASGGSNGGTGGLITFAAASSGGSARVVLSGNDAAAGRLDIGQVSTATFALGSLEGAGGIVNLGNRNFVVGSNNADTSFDGSIRDGGLNPATGGALTKTGSGTLTLSGDSSYTGGTRVADGVLRVVNVNGLGLGSGPVTVQATQLSDLRFSFNASAGAIAITNLGSSTSAFAGGTSFRSSATAATATIVNNASLANGALGGFTTFFATSNAGNATLDNQGSAFVAGAGGIGGGDVRFTDNASAAAATIVNRGGLVAGGEGGQTTFFSASTASAATLINLAAASNGAFSGATVFYDTSTGGSAVLSNAGSDAAARGAGVTEFNTTTTAGSARVVNGGGTATGGNGGLLNFLGTSGGGTATITHAGGTAAGAAGGVTTFASSSQAQNANLRIEAGAVPGAFGGRTSFTQNSSAGSALFTVEGGRFAEGLQAAHGELIFSGNATAADASITNRGSTAGSVSWGGFTVFDASSSAGNATITSLGASVAGGWAGNTRFNGTSSAGNATLRAAAALMPGSEGGHNFFFGNSSAANSTLDVQAGTAALSGGLVEFFGNSTGGAARAILGGGPGVQPGTLRMASTLAGGTTIGSIEGGGLVTLSTNRLTVGLNDRSATFAGLIEGVGGAIDVVGRGTWTLTGANTYSGGTRIGDGVNASSGKLVVANTAGSATGSGPVTVRRGGTLSGGGFITGPVFLQAGGAVVPGDPVTLTVAGDFTWDAGGALSLVLGADDAGSDHLNVLGALIRGSLSAPGGFTIDLVNGGLVVGQRYELLRFGSLQGFAASDFSLTGAAAGQLSFGGQGLSLLVTSAVPEPAAGWLWMLGGAAWLAGLRQRRSRCGPRDNGAPLSSHSSTCKPSARQNSTPGRFLNPHSSFAEFAERLVDMPYGGLFVARPSPPGTTSAGCHLAKATVNDGRVWGLSNLPAQASQPKPNSPRR